MDEVLKKVGLKSSKELEYLIGTGYGRNKVPFADENISEISCHAMGVHVTDPSVKAIIDIGGQDVKGISIDTDGTVKNFAMNDKCAAGTGRFFEAMARSFELSLPEFSKLSLTAKNVIPITAQCTVFAESEVITLVGEGKATDEIAAGIEMAVAKRCFVMAKKAGATDSITLTGGCAKNDGLKEAIEAQGHQPQDRPPAHGRPRRCRVCPPEGPGQEVNRPGHYRKGANCKYVQDLRFYQNARHGSAGCRRRSVRRLLLEPGSEGPRLGLQAGQSDL